MDKKKKGMSLKGKDIMPTLPQERTMTNFQLLCTWWGMAIQLVLFIAGAQLYPALSPVEIVMAAIVGNLIVAALLTLNGDIGIRYGITYSVYVRAAFGYMGAHVPSLLRAGFAIFWFGYQTWFCAYAMNKILFILTGYSNETLLIIIFAILQIWNMMHGTKAVALFEKYAAPCLMVVGVYLLYEILGAYNSSVGQICSIKGEGGISFAYAICAMMGHFITMTLNISEFTRYLKAPDPYSNPWWKVNFGSWWSQTIGLVSSLAAFTFIGVCCGVLTGEWNPINVLIEVIGSKSVPLLILCLLFVLFAQWSTNTAANLLPPTYVIVNLCPSKINVKIAALIGGVVGVVMRPWLFADNTTAILVASSALLGPVCGIMICDYYVLRKKNLNVKDLYDEHGQYRYANCWNPAAIISMIVGAVPACMYPDYGIEIAFGVAFVLYYILTKYWIVKKYPQPEITDGWKCTEYTYVDYDPEKD